jgi:acyl-CoA thioester hydrolase
MENCPPSENPLASHTIRLRVRYHETDGQRRTHHANYLHYFERGRVEMLRAAGLSYKALEDAGQMLVVTEMKIQYHAAAEFDDELLLTTETIEVRKVRMRHRYRIERAGGVIVAAESTIACVDAQGRPSRLPEPFFALKP